MSKTCPRCAYSDNPSVPLALEVGKAANGAKRVLRGPEIRGQRRSIAAARRTLRGHGWCRACAGLEIERLASAREMLRDELVGAADWPKLPGVRGRVATMVMVELAIERGEPPADCALFLGCATRKETFEPKLRASIALYHELLACMSTRTAGAS